MKIYQDITQTIGRTPLVRMQRITKGLPADVILKLEFFNPLSSVKDRIGMAMIEDAEKTGALKPGMSILEPTSGNTGIALAFICSAKGYPLTLVMPDTMSMERRTLLLLLGAKLVLTPGEFGMRGAIAKANELFDKQGVFFMPRQFENPANPRIHENTTAQEIWADTDGKVDVVISGVGTGGTFSGVGKFLKAKKSTVKMIAVEPTESAVISGSAPSPHKIQGIGGGFVPKNFNREFLDSVEKVTSDEALAMAKRVIQEEGIPVGISSGAAILAGIRQASVPENKGKMIVVIVPSSAERYLSTLLAQKEKESAGNLKAELVDPEYLAKVPKGPAV